MFQVRIHGRGGQGVVSAAEMLSIAGFLEGKHAQAFPSFGSERMGAPVMAFCRIDDREIRLREPVMAPDALIIQDTTLLHQVNLFEGVTDGGYVLINSRRSVTELGIDEFFAANPGINVQTVPASQLAQEHVGRPVPNAALLGGFAAMTGLIRLDSVLAAIAQKFDGKIASRNQAAAQAAFDCMQRAAQGEEAPC
ncbi:MAG: 2-oxoacid:acceptor oxidoreductase family protein [Gammaproteobacteria bacterium]|nr:2-oxoacid:acceptor oxidoreductase family protein [Gammaproteobacteria bacterium]